MNWDAIGAIGEVVGGVGVIITLVYLAMQLKSNTAQLRSDAYQRHLETYRSWFSDALLDREIAGILIKGLNDYRGLSAVDQMLFHGATNQVVLAYVANLRLHEDGILDERDFEMWERDVARVVTSKGGSQWWDDMKGAYWPHIRDHIDQIAQERMDDPGLETYFESLKPPE